MKPAETPIMTRVEMHVAVCPTCQRLHPVNGEGKAVVILCDKLRPGQVTYISALTLRTMPVVRILPPDPPENEVQS